VFFVDLPGRNQKDQIRGIDTGQFGLGATQARPDDANWTGAEIKSCCRLAGAAGAAGAGGELPQP
jgi:hypothetical protein